MTLLIGADPELFVTKDSKFVSAYGMVEGTKANPQPVEKGAVQVDGMALEFNIDPTDDADEFASNIAQVLGQMRSMIPSDYDFTIESSMEVPDDVMATSPADALELGCEPDFNAYMQGANSMPDQSTNIRTAAGHIHIGWGEGLDCSETGSHFLRCCALARQLDCSLGVYGLLNDDDSRRKQMYGRAGAFRPKPYGMEYRVLSNFWLKSAEHTKRVFELASKGYNDYMSGDRYESEARCAGISDVQGMLNFRAVEPAKQLQELLGH